MIGDPRIGSLYDTECVKLARHFLEEEAEADRSEQQIAALAAHIQDAVENFFNIEKQNDAVEHGREP